MILGPLRRSERGQAKLLKEVRQTLADTQEQIEQVCQNSKSITVC